MNKNHFLSLVFNQPHCHGNSTHPSQNARIITFVINLDSCKKRAPKHKQFKSYGELGIGTCKLCSATLKQLEKKVCIHLNYQCQFLPQHLLQCSLLWQWFSQKDTNYTLQVCNTRRNKLFVNKHFFKVPMK